MKPYPLTKNFFGRLHDHALSLDSDDILVWVDTKNGVFFVKSLYSSLANRGVDPFPHGMVWNSQAPIRVSFFAWEATWAKILMQDQLRKRSWKMPNKYYIYKEGEETSDHILLHCSKACIL